MKVQYNVKADTASDAEKKTHKKVEREFGKEREYEIAVISQAADRLFWWRVTVEVK